MAAPHVRPRVRAGPGPTPFEPPYPPGWFDALIDWIDRAPGPNALYPIGLLVAQAAYVTGLIWWNGKLPFGVIDPQRMFVVVVAPYLIGVRYYLDRVACAALDQLRPAMTVDEGELERLRYMLTTLPRRTTRIITAVGVVFFVVNWVRAPAWLMEQYTSSAGTGLLVMGPLGLFTFVIAALSIAQAVHQLQMVEYIHRHATTIRLFRTKPLYAFSHVAARTGMSFLLLIYYVVAVRPDVLLASPPLKLIVVAMVVTAIGCFVLPLRGMHRRIAAEKDRALAKTALRFETLTARLHEQIERGELADADKIAMQLSGVMTERDALSRVSTWPWEGGTVTAFVTTMVLPAIVWVMQRVLARMGF
jgi:hypothetical protein